ncbi:MAG: hypothetical protein HRT68_08910, partial [Flavobacteriaceae bacterium]|nr:hypothetical protein [Flavobacteriaceae bacterium]
DYAEGEFTIKDIGYFGKKKGNVLIDILNKEFDVLITYNREDDEVLNLITLESKSKFKVGFSVQDQRLNDLVIDIKTKDISAFNNELIKYLKILNKL